MGDLNLSILFNRFRKKVLSKFEKVSSDIEDLSENISDLDERVSAAESTLNLLPMSIVESFESVKGTQVLNEIQINESTREVKAWLALTGSLGGSGAALATMPIRYKPSRTIHPVITIYNNTLITSPVTVSMGSNGVVSQGGSGNLTQFYAFFNYYY